MAVVILRTVSRLVRRALTVLIVAAAARNVLGVLVSSVLLTGWGLWAGVRAWSRLEQRLDRRARPLAPDVIHPRSSAEHASGHLAFARGLAAVSATYLSHCEQEASER
jgi:hypothetical protein